MYFVLYTETVGISSIVYNETVGISCSTFFVIQFVASDIHQMQSNYLPFLNIIIGRGLIPEEAKLAVCAHM